MPEDDQQRRFHDWLKSHQWLFFKVVRAYAFTRQDQEDLFQEIATQVWRSVPNFRGESAVTTWIYRVALNAAIAWTQKERKHRSGKQSLDGVEPGDPASLTVGGPTDRVALRADPGVERGRPFADAVAAGWIQLQGDGGNARDHGELRGREDRPDQGTSYEQV